MLVCESSKNRKQQVYPTNMGQHFFLKDLLQHIGIAVSTELVRMPIRGISFLPSEINENVIGIGIRDWHGDYHEKVLESKAKILILDRPAIVEGKIIFQVKNANIALSRLCAEFENRPADKLPIIGITGTNGKTTITTLVSSALATKGWKVGSMGTLGATIANEPYPLSRTTPNPPELHRIFSEMVKKNCTAAVMEVGSFALRANRVDDVGFHLGVFTNLTRDHLDVHKTMEVYAEAKARLFECLRPKGKFPRALLCADDPNWQKMNPPKDRWTYGFDKQADLRLCNPRYTIQHSTALLETPLGSINIQSQLPGHYNLQNTTAAIGILLSLDFSLDEACTLIENADLPPGRAEFIPNDRGLNLVIDYAHTPDGLEKILNALRPATKGNLWVLFGCGGFRDVGKRAEMGRKADSFADKVVLTTDNSRNEQPQNIIKAIQKGMRKPPAHIELNRTAAIAWVIQTAKQGDTIVFAGMGHERSQIIGNQEIYFNEQQIIHETLKNLQ